MNPNDFESYQMRAYDVYVVGVYYVLTHSFFFIPFAYSKAFCCINLFQSKYSNWIINRCRPISNPHAFDWKVSYWADWILFRLLLSNAQRTNNLYHRQIDWMWHKEKPFFPHLLCRWCVWFFVVTCSYCMPMPRMANYLS